MLRTEGAKLEFKLRPVSCPNLFSSCATKHLRPIKETECTGLGCGKDGLVIKSKVKGESQVSGLFDCDGSWALSEREDAGPKGYHHCMFTGVI